MRGFGLLLMLALAVVAIAICGPPAVDAGQNDTYMQIVATVVENSATAPAASLVVRDPGSTDDLSATTAFRLNILPAVRPRNIFRQGVRLLCFRALSC